MSSSSAMSVWLRIRTLHPDHSLKSTISLRLSTFASSSLQSARTILNIAKKPSRSPFNSLTSGFIGSPADRLSRSATFCLRFRSLAMVSTGAPLISFSSAESTSLLSSSASLKSARSSAFKPKSEDLKASGPSAAPLASEEVDSAAIF